MMKNQFRRVQKINLRSNLIEKSRKLLEWRRVCHLQRSQQNLRDSFAPESNPSPLKWKTKTWKKAKLAAQPLRPASAPRRPSLLLVKREEEVAVRRVIAVTMLMKRDNPKKRKINQQERKDAESKSAKRKLSSLSHRRRSKRRSPSQLSTREESGTQTLKLLNLNMRRRRKIQKFSPIAVKDAPRGAFTGQPWPETPNSFLIALSRLKHFHPWIWAGAQMSTRQL